MENEEFRQTEEPAYRQREREDEQSAAENAYRQNLANTIARLARKVKSERSALITLVIFSVVNIFLIVANINLMFLFTLEIPYVSVVLCQYISQETGNSLPLLISLIGSLLFISLFFMSYLLSARRFWPCVLALVLFCVDVAVLLFEMLVNAGSIAQYLINFAFHIWGLVYLINLVRNTPKLFRAVTEYNQRYAPRDEAAPR